MDYRCFFLIHGDFYDIIFMNGQVNTDEKNDHDKQLG